MKIERWSNNDTNLLIEHWESSTSVPEIQKMLPQRTKRAVYTMASLLNLKRPGYGWTSKQTELLHREWKLYTPMSKLLTLFPDKSEDNIYKKTRWDGLKRRFKHPIGEEEMCQAIKLREQGSTIQEIADELDRPHGSISNAFQDRGLVNKYVPYRLREAEEAEKQADSVLRSMGCIDVKRTHESVVSHEPDDYQCNIDKERLAVNVQITARERNIQRLIDTSNTPALLLKGTHGWYLFKLIKTQEILR